MPNPGLSVLECAYTHKDLRRCGYTTDASLIVRGFILHTVDLCFALNKFLQDRIGASCVG